MKLEHFGMAEPGDCRVVFSATAAELEEAVQAVRAAPGDAQDEDDLLTAAVNRAILEGFSPLFAQLMAEHGLQPVTDPDFELLAVNRAEGFRVGAQFFCLPPLELGEYTGFVQSIQPRPIRELTIELEINRNHGDEDRAADAEGRRELRARVTQEIYAQRCQQARAVAEQALIAQLGTQVTGPLPKQLVAGNYFAEQRQFNLRMQANGINFEGAGPDRGGVPRMAPHRGGAQAAQPDGPAAGGAARAALAHGGRGGGRTGPLGRQAGRGAHLPLKRPPPRRAAHRVQPGRCLCAGPLHSHAAAR